MSYDREQAGRETSAYLHSTGGLALREQHEKLQAGYVAQIFNCSTSVSHFIQNPEMYAEALARWQGIEFEKKRMAQIMEEGKRNDD